MSENDEVKLCRKGLHPMTPDNITLRSVPTCRSGYSKSCEACFNARMKLYMRGMRDKKKLQVG